MQVPGWLSAKGEIVYIYSTNKGREQSSGVLQSIPLSSKLLN